ncbi:cation:proton antiporter domain-containing protein [Streptomyces werraensis]|uniref:cation:proton antiporter domain-containing protein n=1 Tax=Streptomyces werraensis TaxID=68284 RepID=UPI0037D480AC
MPPDVLVRGTIDPRKPGARLTAQNHDRNGDEQLGDRVRVGHGPASITAFPVLARILDDRGLHGTPVGALAMACAAVDDVTAWCLLAVVMATIASTGLLGAGVTALAAAGFVVVLLGVVRPLLGRRAHPAERHADSVAS